MPDSAYLDSCVFIDILQKDKEERRRECEALVLAAEQGKLIIVTSAFTIAEVNKLSALGSLTDSQSRQIIQFFQQPYIAVRALTREIAEFTHTIIREHGLTHCDAIHVATAALARVNVLYTYDSPKGKRKGLLRHSEKIGTPPLRIERPPDPDAGTLFDKKNR